MTIDLDKLEALARAATPGPWEDLSNHPDHLRGTINKGEKHIAGCSWFETWREEQHVSVEEALANAAFIAAANPAVVLELIAMCRRLHWTTEKPTKPDYYWHKDDTEDGLLDIAYIYGDQDSGMFCCFAGEKEPTLLDLVTGEWAGPIPEPKESEND